MLHHHRARSPLIDQGQDGGRRGLELATLLLARTRFGRPARACQWTAPVMLGRAGRPPGLSVVALPVPRIRGPGLVGWIPIIATFLDIIAVIGMLLAFADARKQGWPDKLAKTFVIRPYP